jgi:hypothetical protein
MHACHFQFHVAELFIHDARHCGDDRARQKNLRRRDIDACDDRNVIRLRTSLVHQVSLGNGGESIISVLLVFIVDGGIETERKLELGGILCIVLVNCGHDLILQSY